MVTFFILAIVFAVVGYILGKKNENRVFVCLVSISLYLATLSWGYTLIVPYTPINVVVEAEDGKLKEIDEAYYQDDNGSYYIEQSNTLKVLFVPFYQADYVETELPDNAYIIEE